MTVEGLFEALFTGHDASCILCGELPSGRMEAVFGSDLCIVGLVHFVCWVYMEDSDYDKLYGKA